MGWVNRRRDLGNLIFIDVRDRTGVTQVVFNDELNPALHEKASTLRKEYVVAVIGKCKRREPDTINKNIETGEIELIAEELKILNDSKQPPFLPGETVLPNEEIRLQYRYLDLRREPCSTISSCGTKSPWQFVTISQHRVFSRSKHHS